jgi:hypothetical protein
MSIIHLYIRAFPQKQRRETREGQSAVNIGEDEANNGKGLEVVLVRVNLLFEVGVVMTISHILHRDGFALTMKEEETAVVMDKATVCMIVYVKSYREKNQRSKEQ